MSLKSALITRFCVWTLNWDEITSYSKIKFRYPKIIFSVFSAMTVIWFKDNMRHNCDSHISLLFHESTKTTEPRHLGCCRVKLFLHGSSLHSVVVVYFVWWFWIVRRLSDHYKRRPFQFLCDKFLIPSQFLCNSFVCFYNRIVIICSMIARGIIISLGTSIEAHTSAF